MAQFTLTRKHQFFIIACLIFLLVILLSALKNNVSGASTDATETISIQQICYQSESQESSRGSYVVSVKGTKGNTYELLRKRSRFLEAYEVVDTQTATEDTVTLKDNRIADGGKYYYKVREQIPTKLGGFQKGETTEAVQTLPTVDSMNLSVENESATLTWEPVKNANGYVIYRKLGTDGTYQKLGTLDLREDPDQDLSFQDVYGDSFSDTDKGTYLDGKYHRYLDPDNNPAIYAVAAAYLPMEDEEETDTEEEKCALQGYYSNDGVFQLATPTISTLSLLDENGNKLYAADLKEKEAVSANLSWRAVPNATGYYIYTGRKSTSSKQKVAFEKVLDTADEAAAEQMNYRTNVTVSNGEASTDLDVTTHTVTLPYNEEQPYITVQAYFVQEDGTINCSDYDETFTTENRTYADTSVLYIGDSIAYGSPYTTQETGYQYSFPFRVQQLLGITTYNASIPGATVANKENSNCRHFVTSILDQMRKGTKPACNSDLALEENDKALEDFDVIVLEGGANDYAKNVELGKEDDRKQDTFYGAFNLLMDAIEKASEQREQDGKEPIKVVFVDLFYSEKNNDDIDTPEDRQVAQNDEGLTYKDYQEAIETIYAEWETDSDLRLYHFRTSDYNIVSSSNCASVTTDNLHLTAQSYTKLGTIFADFLRETVLS